MTKNNCDSKQSDQRSAFSKELVLVVAIPLLTVIAGIATVVIASQHGFSAYEPAETNRFGQQAEP